MPAAPPPSAAPRSRHPRRRPRHARAGKIRAPHREKILQRELTLTRAQGSALRFAIENRTPADADTAERRSPREGLRQKISALEAGRSTLHRPLASQTTAPGDHRALADTRTRPGAALDSANRLRDENDQLKTATTGLQAKRTKAAAPPPRRSPRQNAPTITASVTSDVTTLSTIAPDAIVSSPFISNAIV